MTEKNPWAGKPREGTATVKFGDKFDAPWLVLAGNADDMKADLIRAFGWDASTSAETPLVNLLAQASVEAKAAYVAAQDLKGTVVSSKSSRGTKAAPKAKAAATPEAEEPAPVAKEAAPAESTGDNVDQLIAAFDAIEPGDDAKIELISLVNANKAEIGKSEAVKEAYRTTRKRLGV